jgi:polysaccharide biosynthesis/export protein
MNKLYTNVGGSSALSCVVAWRGQRCFLAICALAFSHRASSISAQDLSVIATQQQTNDRIRSLGATSKSSPHDYTIGNGDLLSVTVFEVPELSKDVRVSQAGTIGLPLVPTRLHVTGLTEVQAEQLIADVLQANGLVSHPEVGVIVKEHKSNPITIVGAVAHPMVYEADHRVTLLEALAEAGGVSADAGDTIIVTRGHPPAFVMIPNPEPISNPAPGSADSAVAPVAEADEQKTTANYPVFPPAPDSAQSQTPAAASAPNDPTTPAAPGSSNIITVNLNELIEKGDTRNNILLQPGDIVTVPHAGIVYVLGAVNRPGGFVVSNDRTQLTTMKVLALAGGLKNVAKLDHAVIIRKDDQGKQTETEVDLKKVLHQQSEDLQMRASDILYIPDSHTKQFLLQAAALSLAIAGAVAIYRIGYQ